MPRFVPSQIRDYIDERFPSAKAQTEGGQGSEFPPDYAGALSRLVFMIDHMPDHLLHLRGMADAEFGESVEAIRIVVAAWSAGDRTQSLRFLVGKGGWSPVSFIRKHLGGVPDETPRHDVSQLGFVTDQALRDTLSIDLSAVEDALARSSWKAATVLAGSVVESLLLDAVSTLAAEAERAARARKFASPANSLRWDLHELTAVAQDIGLIGESTATQCQLARGFRNLIHPGRALRTTQVCDRGTALATVAAVELVVRDLQRRAG